MIVNKQKRKTGGVDENAHAAAPNSLRPTQAALAVKLKFRDFQKLFNKF